MSKKGTDMTRLLSLPAYLPTDEALAQMIVDARGVTDEVNDKKALELLIEQCEAELDRRNRVIILAPGGSFRIGDRADN